MLRGHSLTRSVGQNYIIDEFIVRFAHTVRMDWLAPGIEPTGWVQRSDTYQELAEQGLALILPTAFANINIAKNWQDRTLGVENAKKRWWP